MSKSIKRKIGFVGLGKMGLPMVQRLKRKKWKVLTFDSSGKGNTKSIEEMIQKLNAPRIIWIMVPAGRPVDSVLGELALFLKKGDTVIDGGNSYYKDSARRAAKLKKKGVHYLDVGVSGGPVSIRQGRFALMAGGEKRIYEKARPLFSALSDTQPGYMGKSGAGHFAKMVHNGIEYGMMQALAEGFSLLKKAPFGFSLKNAVKTYNQNSIITSRLTSWLQEGFEKYGEDLHKVSGSVGHSGEGEWTVKAAKELGVKVPVIKEAVAFRIGSAARPSFAGKILSVLRAVFGGHKI